MFLYNLAVSKLYRKNESITIKMKSLRSSTSITPLNPNNIELLCFVNYSIPQINLIFDNTQIDTSIQTNVLQNTSQCTKLCSVNTEYDTKTNLVDIISNEYRLLFYIDDIPVTKHGIDTKNSITVPGIPIGYNRYEEYYIVNHINYIISLIEKDNGYIVYDFEYMDYHSTSDDTCSSDSGKPLMGLSSINFSYSVQYKIVEKNKPNKYKLISKYYITSVYFSLAFSILTASLFAYLMFKLFISNQSNAVDEDPLLESGWKLVRGDVFRSPDFIHYLFLYTFCGLVFLLPMFLYLILNLFINAIDYFKYFIYFGEYISSFFVGILFKLFGTRNWRDLVCTSIVCSFFLISIFSYIISSFLRNGCDRISFSFLDHNLFILDDIISILVICVGYYCGFASPKMKLPCGINSIQRLLPIRAKRAVSKHKFILSSLLCVSPAIVHYHILMTSVWCQNITPNFTYTLMVFILSFITTCECSIVSTIECLRNENFHWWWPSFYSCSYSGIILFCYSVIFLLTTYRPAGIKSFLVYIEIHLYLSVIMSLVYGSVGFISSFIFVKYLYTFMKYE